MGNSNENYKTKATNIEYILKLNGLFGDLKQEDKDKIFSKLSKIDEVGDLHEKFERINKEYQEFVEKVCHAKLK
ncbi:hypothetical protein FACS1894113_2800 [Alphaproteobacteria bacterium]|nr:hypothetical protein FACS1894113_2800 [Alphaproteobacteria bacterium]